MYNQNLEAALKSRSVRGNVTVHGMREVWSKAAWHPAKAHYNGLTVGGDSHPWDTLRDERGRLIVHTSMNNEGLGSSREITPACLKPWDIEAALFAGKVIGIRFAMTKKQPRLRWFLRDFDDPDYLREALQYGERHRYAGVR